MSHYQTRHKHPITALKQHQVKPASHLSQVHTMSGLRFYIVNAFTTDPYGGNPAVVVPVQDFPEVKIMQAIAKNFNQPMVSFIRATGSDSEVANFDVRWFSPAHEVKLCGHATLASSKLIFSTPSLVPTSVKLLNFKTASGRLLTARKDGDWIEMTIPTGAVQEPSPEEFERLAAIIRQGLGKDVTVKHIEVGGEGYEEYLLAEIEEKDDLGGCQLNHDAFVSTAVLNSSKTLTHATRKQQVVWQTSLPPLHRLQVFPS